MTLFGRKARPPADRITSERLADFGRWEFLREQSGIDPSKAYDLISPLNELIYTQSPADRAVLVAELGRHAEHGEWEKVGAWKYVREFLDESPDTLPLIDEGLRAIERMRCTNLAFHLPMIDKPRWMALFGQEPPHDGFFGPPVFDSSYGPGRQYYFDHAVTTAFSRAITKVPSSTGVEPGDLDEVAGRMWDFGMLIHRGPLVVPPDISFEPNVVRPAVQAATNVDHVRFTEKLAEAIRHKTEHDRTWMANLPGWRPLGAARFIEDYLDAAAMETPGYSWLLEAGLQLVIDTGDPGVSFPAEVLTPTQYANLEQMRSAST